MQVEDFCNRIPKGIIKQFKYALVWGTSVKHRPQKVGKEHVLHDEDIIQVRTGHARLHVHAVYDANQSLVCWLCAWNCH